ncbi:putative nucleoside transporter YegT [Posidoniimonas polymericola]|uniref:Putative nucleoside transporter YegT n=2 Tax=Posidoniimonas polymericola TaxID=2528002 RepID=A0A5C5YPI8_9BACT|nr:putative nucleoside transporter YegT [Posidoniimonas polymericola]
MMALQWATIGAWTATLATYIGANTQPLGDAIFGASFVGDIGAAAAFGALFSPVLCGILVDRWFNIEHVLSALNILACGLLIAMSFADQQGLFFMISVAYYLVYAPTGALCSSIALRRLPNSARDFPRVRAMGTVGYIVSASLVGLWPLLTGHSIEATVVPMWIGGVVHAAYAVYALTLPLTPPEETESGGQFSGVQKLWRSRGVLLFLGFSVLAAIPFRGYESFINLYLNQNDYTFPAWVQTFAQYSEVLVMVAIPLLTARFSLKSLLLVGVLAWAARFALLAFSNGAAYPWMTYTAIMLHGFSFVLVFILGQLYIDRLAPAGARASAQGMHVLAVFGIGTLIGSRLTGWAQSVWLTPLGVDPPPYEWQKFWLLQCGVSLAAAAMFAIFFIETPLTTGDASASPQPPEPGPEELAEAEAHNPTA